MKYINYILSISNLFGLFSFVIAKKKNTRISLFILIIIIVSSLHHITEKNEMGHSLEGIKIFGLDKYSYEIRFLDMVLAYSFFIYLMNIIGIYKIIIFIMKNKIIVSISLLSSFICDYLLFNKPNVYLFFHLIWHIGIYYIIYKIIIIF